MTQLAPQLPSPLLQPDDAPFVRRPWCLRLALGLLALGLFLNLLYLWHNCPIELSEDEAHYWEWSRHLDYGYYSKGPGIAWIMWTATHLAALLGAPKNGALAPVLRTSAVLFSTISGLLSLALARRLWRDDRVALMVTALSAAVPMFVLGALLITIDSPMYMFWAATLYCLWRYIEPKESPNPTAPSNPNDPSALIENRKSKIENNEGQKPKTLWLYASALTLALGLLCKPVLIAIPLCAALAMAFSPTIRQKLATRHSLAALALTLTLQFPILYWNYAHDFVTFRHLGGQAGLGKSSSHWYTAFSRLGEFLAGQIGGMGGLMFILLALAVFLALRSLKSARTSSNASPESRDALALKFLLTFSLPLWGFYLLMNLWAKTQVNWPAASYFTGMILLAGVATRFWNAPPGSQARRNWRGWTSAALLWGLLLAAAVQNLHLFYALVPPAQKDNLRSASHPRRWDPSLRIRAVSTRANLIQQVRDQMTYEGLTCKVGEPGNPPLLATSRYGNSSVLSFYLPDQPFVYSLMSIFGGRHSQYDLWPNLAAQDPSGHLLNKGRNLLLIADADEATLPATVDALVRPAFSRVEGPQTIPVYHLGLKVREITLYRCYNYQGGLDKPLGGY